MNPPAVETQVEMVSQNSIHQESEAPQLDAFQRNNYITRIKELIYFNRNIKKQQKQQFEQIEQLQQQIHKLTNKKKQNDSVTTLKMQMVRRK